MKRPLGIWILLSAGVLWLSTQDVHGIRATSLILAKTSTTTTTTSTAATTLSQEEIDVTEAIDGATNSTKPVLTGIPQIDYVYDPNLPKELNGYNLSDYPFYERVPGNITFKCDGLHDGFYASVPHKCQVYHHCLFGTRFDFLCANYTAFDQKTFICHFASEVDCNNSKKFWHRNDALYQAATTTTSKPLIIPTTSPASMVVLSTSAIPSGPGIGQWRGGGRPYRRRRPYYEYYEDYYDDFYYDDRPRSRGRKRPRPRPRPVYEDDYEDEYEDEVYDRRGGGGRRKENRRPYSRRPNSNRGRNKDIPRYDYDDEYYEFEDEKDTNSRRRKPTDKNKKSTSRRRPAENGSEGGDNKQKSKSETRTVIKPVSGTIYDRPRLAPKLKLPVPKNEANKYAYKPITTTEVVPKSKYDYDSYEDDIKSKKSNNKTKQKQKISENKPRGLGINDDEKIPDDDYYYDNYDEDSSSKEKDTVQKESSFSSKREKEKPNEKDTKTTTSSTTSSTTTTTTTQSPLVYHHCLFGIRYDFLCANYTAFDQTLFNCNFVSNVDCENSKKFWNRNDELYKAKSTTPPPIVYTFYTPSPPVYTAQGSPIRRGPQRRIPVLVNPASVPVESSVQQAPPPASQTDDAAIGVPSDLPPQPAVVEIPLEPRRRARPPMRVRPYYDYYEEYDEPPRYTRKRPRPRPVYDDDDYEYYDDRLYRRNEGRRRRPYDRPIRRYKGRRDRYEDEEYDDYADEEDLDKRKLNRGGTMSGNTRFPTKRKPIRTSQTTGKPNRRPIVDDEYEEYDKRPTNDSPKNRRPAEYEDDDLEGVNQKTNKKSGTSEITLDESKTIIKPNSGTIFDRPRVAPKINLPVPKNVAEKYSYKAMSSKPIVKEEVDSEEENESEHNLPNKQDQSNTQVADVTTIRGNFKRTVISRRPAEGKVIRSTKKPPISETEQVDEEIQESKANTRQTTIKMKNPVSKESAELSESSKKEVRRSEGQNRQRGTTKFNSIYKTRHSLSTPEARELDNSNDFIDIDDSINEA